MAVNNIPEEQMSGTGNKSLTISCSENFTRNTFTKKYKLQHNGSDIGNTLTITQAGVPLSISCQSGHSITASTGSTLTITGTANGRYIWFTTSVGSGTLAEDSGGSSHTIPSVNSAVSQFGGTYNYTLTILIPQNATPDTYSIAISTYDESGDFNSQSAANYSISVTISSGSVAVSSVTVTPGTLTLEAGSTDTLSVTVSPSEANQQVRWRSEDQSAVAVYPTSNTSGGCTVTAASLSGVWQKTCKVYAQSTSDSTKQDYCNVTVYARGQINVAGNISVASIITEASTSIETGNIKTNTLSVSKSVSDTWITGCQIDKTTTPYYLRVTAQSNGTGLSSRTGTLTITGEDLLGNTITQQVTFTQRAPSSDDVPCTSMEVQPSGSVSINNAGNSQTFEVTYTPAATTQRGCNWVLTDANGNAVSSSVAYLEPDSDPALDNVIYLRVGSSASSTQLRLKAVNSYNQSKESNTVNITATYVAPLPSGTIESKDGNGNNYYNVTAGFTDDRIDTTNGAPYITSSGLSGSLVCEVLSGFIDRVELLGGRLYAYFTYNSGSQRTSTVRIKDSGNYSTYIDIQFTQLAYQQPAANEIHIVAIEGSPSPSSPTTVRFAVTYENMEVVSDTFTNQRFTLVGKNSSNNQTFAVTNQSLQDVTVAPRKIGSDAEYRIYSVSVSPTGTTTYYNLTVSATSRNQTVSDSVTNWGGDDPIDIEPGTN